MATFKITDYPSKTLFNDGDLYDVSSYDGVSAYTSEKMTFAQLKTELNSALNILYNADGTLTSARTVTLTGTNTLTFTGGLTTMKGQDATSSNFVSKFLNSANTELMVVRNDGFVGIGTNTPVGASILSVNGFASFDKNIAVQGTSPSSQGGVNFASNSNLLAINGTKFLWQDAVEGVRFQSLGVQKLNFDVGANKRFLELDNLSANVRTQRNIAVDSASSDPKNDIEIELQPSYWNGAASANGSVKLTAESQTTSGDTSWKVDLNGTDSIKVDESSTAGDTRFLIYDVDNATLERVTVGAADSGGTGFKVLRIPN